VDPNVDPFLRLFQKCGPFVDPFFTLIPDHLCVAEQNVDPYRLHSEIVAPDFLPVFSMN